MTVAPNNSISMYSDTSAADNFTPGHSSHHTGAATVTPAVAASSSVLSAHSASLTAADNSSVTAASSALDSRGRHLSSSTSSEAGKSHPSHLNRVS